MTLSIPRIQASSLMAVLLLAVAGCSGSTGGSDGSSSGGSDGGGGSTPPPTVTGSATLSWRAPTLNEDGSPLTNLAGYRVRYGTNAGALSSVRDIPNPGTTTVTIQGLTAGTWYFTLHSYTNVGVESTPTAPVSKTIG